jgi:hypothetical protein
MTKEFSGIMRRPIDWKSRRFDYVKYDALSQVQQIEAKDLCLDLEYWILTNIKERPASLALTKLEELYMWIGKAIRDQQVTERKDDTPQEERGDE